MARYVFTIEISESQLRRALIQHGDIESPTYEMMQELFERVRDSVEAGEVGLDQALEEHADEMGEGIGMEETLRAAQGLTPA